MKRIRTKVEKLQKRQRERNSNSARRHQSFADRRSLRRAKLGRQTEDRVKELLFKKLEAGELVSFEHFPPYSPEDCQGKDFRVTRPIGGEKITAYFGVTISLQCQQEHQEKHPDVPSIIIPPEMTDERIWQRICRICEEQANNNAQAKT